MTSAFAKIFNPFMASIFSTFSRTAFCCYDLLQTRCIPDSIFWFLRNLSLVGRSNDAQASASSSSYEVFSKDFLIPQWIHLSFHMLQVFPWMRSRPRASLSTITELSFTFSHISLKCSGWPPSISFSRRLLFRMHHFSWWRVIACHVTHHK